uniref:BTB domain-containing protein n=1 Tax=Syphacia muris TaxID=451379 RepID=A0A0N5AUW3_9BILA
MSAVLTCLQSGNGSLNPMSFTDPHGNVLLERLRYQRDTGRFCDVYLVVKDRRFSAHRNILAACSPYFDSIFKNSRVVKEQVTVNCQNPAVFELLLNYMYSGSVVIDRSSVMDLLRFANNFLVTKVKNYCAEYLVRHMDEANCITIKELALKYNLPALRDSAMNFFELHINNCLLESTDMVEYSYPQVTAFFSDPRYVSGISPDAHLKFIIRWVSHNPMERVSFLKQLLQCCPLNAVSLPTIEVLLDCSPFLANSLKARYIFLQTMFADSIPLSKYESQYHSLMEQFDNEVYFAGQEAVVFSHNENQPSQSLHCKEQLLGMDASSNISNEHASNILPDAIPSQSDVAETSSIRETVCGELFYQKSEYTQFCVAGKTSAAVERHKLYRKSVTAANQMLAKRRGRPPKNREPLTRLDQQFGDEAVYICGPRQAGNSGQQSEQVTFEEPDEVNPLLLQDEVGCADAAKEPVETNSFKCRYCEFSAVQEKNLKNHVTRAHGRNMSYTCSLCPFQSHWNKEYYDHMNTHYQGPPFHCENCSYADDRIHVFLAHCLTHNDERPIKCLLCTYKSRSKANMLAHLNDHSTDKQFYCLECGCGFSSQEQLTEHSSSHTESRPYQCSQCKFSTKYQSHYISHRRIHSGDVFHCHYESCTYYSPKKSQLAAHLRTHLAVRSHQCKICSRSFIEKSHLVRHERIHLEDKPFKCDNCDYASSRRDKLKEHIQKHHSSGAISKQHRRRYRRNKEVLPTSEKIINYENLFQPIPESGISEISGSGIRVTTADAIVAQQQQHQQKQQQQQDPQNSEQQELSESHQKQQHPPPQQQPETSGHYVLTGMENLGQNQDTPLPADLSVSQSQELPVLNFFQMQNVSSLGRPSSAVIPHAVVNNLVSPSTLSLHNFHFAVSESPIIGNNKDVSLSNALVDSGSLRTPVLGHTSSPHSIAGLEGFDNGSGWQNVPRPMSEPSYLMQQQQSTSFGDGDATWHDATLC